MHPISKTWLALGLCSCLVACSDSKDDATGGDGGANGLGGDGDTGGGIGSGNGNGFGDTSSGPLDFPECTSEATGAEGGHLDMFVTLDHTGSMGNDCPLDLDNPPAAGGGGGGGNANDKWCFATHALAQYFVSDSAQGHRAALQYMSLENGLCEGGPNNGAATAAVSLTNLPVAPGAALITNLDNDGPTGGLGTQIEAALRGITTYTGSHATPGRAMIGLLITDGDPNGCDENIDNLAAIVGDHLAATGVRTFIVGMTGASLDNLETIAAAGGAPAHGPAFCGPGVNSCHYWSVGDGDPVAFVDALNEIQAAAVLPCEYTIPPPPPGKTLNSALVNVTFTDAQGGDQFISTAGVVGQCAANNGGWYYDNPSAPRAIRLCEGTCDAVTAAGSGANLRIVYGCGECPADIPDEECASVDIPGPPLSPFCRDNPDAPECFLE